MSRWSRLFARFRRRPFAADSAAADRRLDALLDRAAPSVGEAAAARVLAALAVLPPQDRPRRWGLPAAAPPGRAPWPAFAAMAMASVVGIAIGISGFGSSLGGSDADYSVLDDTPTLTAALEP